MPGPGERFERRAGGTVPAPRFGPAEVVDHLLPRSAGPRRREGHDHPTSNLAVLFALPHALGRDRDAGRRQSHFERPRKTFCEVRHQLQPHAAETDVHDRTDAPGLTNARTDLGDDWAMRPDPPPAPGG